MSLTMAATDWASVHDLMIDKQTGQVAYAIMSFGGFLGMGNSYHPLPWSLLRYNPNLGGYIVELDESQLRGAPSYPVGTEPAWGDPEYEGKLQDYYGVGPAGASQDRFDALPSGAPLGAKPAGWPNKAAVHSVALLCLP